MTAVLRPASWPALGTNVVLLVTDADAGQVARAAVEAEIAAIDAACSRFRPDSELAALNAAAGGRPVHVSAVLADAIEVALRAAHVTAGRVTPTVGSTMRVLGYDRSFFDVERSGPPLRITVGAVPGWETIRVDAASRTVSLPAGVELDLGATAKARCADRAAAAAAAACGAGVLVSLGGDIAVAGEAPAGGWSVVVGDDHAAPLDAPGQAIAITSGGLATSGTSVRRWARGGHTLHHIVDPATGLPATGPWRTVSVAAGSCVDANVASTAAVILGEGAPAWLEERALPARLVARDATVTVVCGWPEERR